MKSRRYRALREEREAAKRADERVNYHRPRPADIWRYAAATLQPQQPSLWTANRMRRAK
jgi:hypothetical protein